MKIKKLLSAFIGGCMLLGFAPMSAFSASASCTAGDFTLTPTLSSTTISEGTDYSFSNNVLTIKSNKAITISGTTTSHRIEIEKNIDANLTFNGLDIFSSDDCAFKIADDSEGDVTITLASGSTNKLVSGFYYAGLQKNGAYSKDLGMLTINGSGNLYAQSGDPDNYNSSGAGIGGETHKQSANITISGGNVTANAYAGAGIGGGQYGGGSYITVSGGNVTTTSGQDGAGIVGGDNGGGSHITVSGGSVTANTYNGAGIGGGFDGEGSNINISGGSVTAIVTNQGAGIGGGRAKDGKSITIKNAKVKATSNLGAGIGGGCMGAASDITIENSTVTSTSTSGAGIGGGNNYNNATGGTLTNIKIKGGSVKAIGENEGANIGTGGGNNYIRNPDIVPQDTNGNSVYLLKISNPRSEAVYIDGAEYTPKDHTAVDSDDKNIYAYLKDEHHTVKVGNEKMGFEQTCYHYANGFSQCNVTTNYAYSDSEHWNTCSKSSCTAHHNPASHSYFFKSNETQYWKECVCKRKEATPKNIPEITINANEKANRNRDYTYTVSYPEGVTITSATGVKNTNGYTISKNTYSENSLSISVNAQTSDGFSFSKIKSVNFKESLKASDFVFTPPQNTVYDGNPKTASFTSKKVSSDKITISYYDSRYNPLGSELPTVTGKYYVGINVAESDDYESADIKNTTWTFTIQKSPSQTNTTSNLTEVTYGGNLELKATVRKSARAVTRGGRQS